MTPTSDPSMTDLEGIASYFEYWLIWQERERSREGIETTDETVIIKPPSWPSRRQMKAIISAAQDAEKRIAGLEALLVDAQEEIAELKPALKAALDILGHPDDATVQALRAILRKWNT
jgi:hypothetical protein